jgi:hypothetical protein
LQHRHGPDPESRILVPILIPSEPVFIPCQFLKFRAIMNQPKIAGSSLPRPAVSVVPVRPGDVVQLVRTLPCHGRGRGFESRRPRHSFKPLGMIGTENFNPTKAAARLHSSPQRSGIRPCADRVSSLTSWIEATDHLVRNSDYPYGHDYPVIKVIWASV